MLKNTIILMRKFSRLLTSELLIPAVEFVVLVPFDGPEMGQHRHKLLEIYSVILAFLKKKINK